MQKAQAATRGCAAFLITASATAIAAPGCDSSPAARVDPEPHAGHTTSAIAWGRQATLSATDAVPIDEFGYSVAVSGTTVLIGAPNAPGAGGTSPGAGYVYDRSGAAMAFTQKLVANDPAAADDLGWSVALGGDIAVLGAPARNAAYVFRRANAVWSQATKLTPPDAALFDEASGCVGTSGNTVVMGARSHADRGAAYVFVADTAGNWSLQATLVASDGADLDYFGTSCSISGDTILVGAPGRGQGGAYLFTRTGATWTEQSPVLVSTNTGPAGQFGSAVAVSGDLALVGAYDHATPAAGLAGAVYVFTRTGGVWSYARTLSADAPATNDRFGWSVALSPPLVVVGKRRRSKKGEAIVYDASAGFAIKTTLVATPSVDADWYGGAVAVDKDTVVVGASQDSFVQRAGLATVDRLAQDRGEACGAAAECLSGFCVDGLCCDTACGAGAADCQACSVAAGARQNGTCAPLGQGRVCRAAISECDVADACDGRSPACPADAVVTNGTACGAGGSCIGGACDVPTDPGGAPPPKADPGEEGALAGCAIGRSPAGGTVAGLASFIALAIAASSRRRRGHP